MLRTNLYLPQELYDEVERIAEQESKSKAETLREVIRKGVNQKKKARPNKSLEVMENIINLGKKYKLKGPTDLSEKIDEYLWDEHEP